MKGLKSLDDSLDDYLSEEELQGDNQYFCSSCATRVDATRSIRLQSLPPVLIFQLKRCVFLPNVSVHMLLLYLLNTLRAFSYWALVCAHRLQQRRR